MHANRVAREDFQVHRRNDFAGTSPDSPDVPEIGAQRVIDLRRLVPRHLVEHEDPAAAVSRDACGVSEEW
jgi:hypothetical protein